MEKRKIIAYGVRQDELEAFNGFSELYNIELKIINKPLSKLNLEESLGYECISFTSSCNFKKESLELLKKNGVKFVASRSIGYDNVDLDIATKLSIKVSNSSYSPYSVAEFAVMSMMNLLRHLPLAIKKVGINDFSLKGLKGRELQNQTIGVIGTGKIGKTVIKCLSGFGSKVIAYDPFPSDLEDINYVSLEALKKQSDIITLHVPLTEENKHMINSNFLSSVKDGVLIVNTARGELIDTTDLVAGLKSGKIGGAGLDVVEGENGIMFRDCSKRQIDNDNLVILKNMPNVQITPHLAFFTHQAVSDMVEVSLKNLLEFSTTGDATNSLN
ncbi:D-isomer specific 2-hydroxyacid dehydrogenase family protein [Psychrilyobacter sp.]|uniref:D-isomer specific 2-hydroxyacid dehydrogenase family protein n=1 Tax=Psychrilyobacter sp. TaxID=2586924 RepID=UPI00301B58D1